MSKNMNETGRSMVEMLGYMVVVVSIIMAVSKIISSAFEQHKYSQASIQLGELATSITRTAAVDPNYEDLINGINNKNSEAMKVIPPSFSVNDGKIYNAFGGEVEINLEGTNSFYIEYAGLSRKQCIELAMKNWQQNKVVNLKSITINQNDQWFWPSYQTDDDCCTLPVTREKVAGVDDEGQCSEDNTIRWIFY